MGTHPIFESDFDCLTEMEIEEELILTRAKFAKLDPETMTHPSVKVKFADQIDTTTLRLVQLNSDLQQKIESGSELFIRGESEDSVVICTDEKTYDIKLCTTSNQLL